MEGADFLIIGGGIAGLSAAARLARHGKVLVVEAEEALGYHSSGRSVSFSHFGIGNASVRALTAHSRPFYEAQPEGFCETPIARSFPTLYFAGEDTLPELAALADDMGTVTDAIRTVDSAEMARLCPVLRDAVRGLYDPTASSSTPTRCCRPSPARSARLAVKSAPASGSSGSSGKGASGR